MKGIYKPLVGNGFQKTAGTTEDYEDGEHVIIRKTKEERM